MLKIRIESGSCKVGSAEIFVGMPILPVSYVSDRAQFFLSITGANEDSIDLMIRSRLQFDALLKALQKSSAALMHFSEVDDSPFTVTAEIVSAGRFSEIAVSFYTASHFAKNVDTDFASEVEIGYDDIVMTVSVLGDGPDFGLGNGDPDTSVIFQITRSNLKSYADLFGKMGELPFAHAGDSLRADWVEPDELFGIDDLSILASAELQTLLLEHIKNNVGARLAERLVSFHTECAFHFPNVSRCEDCGGYFLNMEGRKDLPLHYSLSSMMDRVEEFKPWLLPISLRSNEPLQRRLQYLNKA